MLAALNDQLQERKLDAQYVTMLMALWDDANQTLRSLMPDRCSLCLSRQLAASLTDAIG